MNYGRRFSLTGMTEGANAMKKMFCFILMMILVLFAFYPACAELYTLPQRMYKQLFVGSGLSGSFVIHGNADSARYPFLNSIENSEYEISGMNAEGFLHYHIYQSNNDEDRNIIAAILGCDGQYFLQSDFLEADSYTLPTADEVISSLFDVHGQNTAVFSSLMKILLSSGDDSAKVPDTAPLENQIDLWLSAFSPETSISRDSQSGPRLTQSFTIPVESMYNTVTELIRFVCNNDSAMSALRAALSEQQIDLYFNPDLAYYYLDAMNHLDLHGNIIYEKTVSTMGDMIESSLTLPLDESKTKYSFITIQNNDQRKNIRISGEKGTFILDMPLSFSVKEKEFSEQIHFVYILSDSADKNLALNISISKTHEEHTDPEETIKYETDFFRIHAVQDVAVLPDDISSELIPDVDPLDIEAEFQFSGKAQLYSSPTALDISIKVLQGLYHYDITGNVITVSPTKMHENFAWSFTPVKTDQSVSAGAFTKTDFLQMLSDWIKHANEGIVRTPEEIRPSVTE